MFSLWADIYEGLRGDRGRFALSVGTIAIGMFSLIILVAVLDGLRIESDRQIRSLGVNVFAIVADQASDAQNNQPLSSEHAQILEANLDDNTISTTRQYLVNTMGSSDKIRLVRTDPDLANIRHWQILQGRNLSTLDLLKQKRVTVISAQLQNDWGWRPGMVVVIGKTTFTIIGVIDTGGNYQQGLSDSRHLFNGRILFVPKSLEPYWVENSQNRDNLIDAIYVSSENAQAYHATLDLSKRLLGSPQLNSQSYSWLTPEGLIKGMSELRDTLAITLGGIAILSIIMGSTTLVSLMTSNIRERRTEIGLRRALGATKLDIQLLFVLESILITLIASLLGYLGCWFIIQTLQDQFPVPIAMQNWYFLVPLVAALVTGSVASIWPARIAAAIEPAQALKS